MSHTSVFRSNRTQAVRLSKDVAFPESVSEVEVVVVGTSRVISPRGASWDHWFAHGAAVSTDFMVDRDEPVAEERGTL